MLPQIRTMLSSSRALAAGLALLAAAAGAQQTAPTASSFITLGTQSGPIANPRRSQPANLLLWRDQAILIDAGDGVAEQLAKGGVPLAAVHTIFLSHLHIDHTGGLFALLGMHSQTLMPGTLTIYGPPGTRRLVDGLVAALQPLSEVGIGIPGSPRRAPDAGITVEEISDGSRVVLGDVTVIAARNSHYSYPEGSPEAARFQSLAFRFDLPDRSIAYTGDTGPSANVERLAHNVDLLVSEVVDPEGLMAVLARMRPDLSPAMVEVSRRHMFEQHLTASAAGQLARHAGARRLVLTHVGSVNPDPEPIRAGAAAAFGGPVTVAADLERF